MGVDVGYTYCINLTEEEKLNIDKEVRKNRVELQMVMYFGLAFLGIKGFSSVYQVDEGEKKEPTSIIRPRNESEQDFSETNGRIARTGSGDLIDNNGKQISKADLMVRGGDGPPASPSQPSSIQTGVAHGFQSSITPGPHAARGKSLFDAKQPGNPKNTEKGVFSGQGSASQKGSEKPPRIPSGFCKDIDKYKNQGLGGSPNPSGSGSSVDFDSASRKRKLADQQFNPNRFYQSSKKGKQSKNPKKIQKTSDRILKRQEVYDRFKEFQKEMLADGFEDLQHDRAYQRYEDMCRDPQTGLFLEKVMFQAEGALYLEAEGVFDNVRVNTDTSIPIDIVAEIAGTGETVFVDSKRAIDFGQRRDNFGNLVAQTAHEPDAKARAFNSGIKAVEQQNKWAEKANGTPIYEFYDLKDFNASMSAELMGSFMDGVEMMGGDPSKILFTRYK